MKFFLDDRVYKGKEETRRRSTGKYLEIEHPISDEQSVYVYYLPIGDDSIIAAACLGDMFDCILENEVDDETASVIAKTWPTFTRMIANGVNDKYHDGALIRMEDPDFCESRWFLVSICGNLDFDNADGETFSRLNTVAETVISMAVDILVEMRDNDPPSKLWRGIKSFARGFMEGAAAVFLSDL